MDWSRTKTILIAILLVLCLILGGILISRRIEENKSAEAGRLAAKEYLEGIGVKINTEIPKSRPSLEVLFLQKEEGSSLIKYGKYNVYSDNSTAYKITRQGKSKAKVITASSALLQVVTGLDNPKGLEINEIELCYYVGGNELNPSETNTDTAIPAWRINTSQGIYYILAY